MLWSGIGLRGGGHVETRNRLVPNATSIIAEHPISMKRLSTLLWPIRVTTSGTMTHVLSFEWLQCFVVD